MIYGWVSITEANNFLSMEAAGQSWAGPSVPLPLTGTVEASPSPSNVILGTGTLLDTELVASPADYILLSDDQLAIVQAITDSFNMTVDRNVTVDPGSSLYKLDKARYDILSQILPRKIAALMTAYREIFICPELNIDQSTVVTQEMKDAQCLRALEIFKNPTGPVPGPAQGIQSMTMGDASVSYFSNADRWGGEKPFSPRIMNLLSAFIIKKSFGAKMKLPDDYGI